MKITISGTPGSGKSTVAKQVAKELKMRHFSSGDFYRKLAEKMGVTPLKLSNMAESDPEIDKKVDGWVVDTGEADDNFVMDSRLGFNFIPDSIKVFLDVSDDEAARRIFKDLRKEEKENSTQGATFEAVKQRKESEKRRYMQYYNIDYTNPDNYDLVIDTTEKPVNDVVAEIIKLVKERV